MSTISTIQLYQILIEKVSPREARELVDLVEIKLKEEANLERQRTISERENRISEREYRTKRNEKELKYWTGVLYGVYIIIWLQIIALFFRK